MLTAFYLGTAGFDVGKFAEFFDFPGGSSFERTFHRESPKVNALVLHWCELIMAEALAKKIEATIREKLCDEYDSKKINGNIQWFVSGEYDKMLPRLLMIGLSVSYDMGWQKRATCRLYDSLPGHGFIIGCRKKIVIGMGVLKKKYSTCRSANKHNGTVRPHECNVNHKDSSGAIESALALALTVSMFST